MDRVEKTVSNSNSIVECVSVAAGTCLPSRCLEMDTHAIISKHAYSTQDYKIFGRRPSYGILRHKKHVSETGSVDGNRSSVSCVFKDII
jgi:hypothetical protein